MIDHNCQLWEFVAGVDPNTGTPINKYMCLDKMGKLLQIETMQHINELGAETHELRNDIALAQGRARVQPVNPRWGQVSGPEQKRIS